MGEEEQKENMHRLHWQHICHSMGNVTYSRVLRTLRRGKGQLKDTVERSLQIREACAAPSERCGSRQVVGASDLSDYRCKLGDLSCRKKSVLHSQVYLTISGKSSAHNGIS